MTEQDLKIQNLKAENKILAEENKKLKEAMERIVERLKESRAECKELQRTTTDAYGYMKIKHGIDCAIKIVKEEGGLNEKDNL